MSYIGSSAAPLSVAFSGVRTQSFNGTGAQTAFTLSRAVSAVTDIEVVVNNVQQSPFDSSYNISGATLTFSEAPSSGTNNIYVIFRDQPVGSLVDPTSVKKAGDTMTGPLVVKSSPSSNQIDMWAASGGNADQRYMDNSGNAKWITSYRAATADQWWLYSNSLGAQVVQADSGGRVNFPYQTSFCAMADSSVASTNISAGGTCSFPIIKHNVGSAYNSSTYTFTAPVAGTYQFYAQVLGDATVNARAITYFRVNGIDFIENSATTKDYNSVKGFLLIKLSASDTVKIINAYSNTLYGSSSFQNFFMGHLIG